MSAAVTTLAERATAEKFHSGACAPPVTAKTRRVARGRVSLGIELEYDEFLAKVRHGGGEMPSISEKEISDDEVKQVFEFLKSL